jgi:dienelactone hydrolase
MAGNVKEWCFNSAGGGKRYALGGAWDEQDYLFLDEDARAAIDRDKNMGFRCVKDLPGQEPPKEAFAEVKRTLRDFLAEKPLSDEVFQVVKGQFAYDKTKPLNAVVERPGEAVYWVHERVAVAAAYGNEQLIVHLFLPKEVAPPYQPVIYWPPATALQASTIPSPTSTDVSFLIRSGRALVWPIYKGTYERKVQVPDAARRQWDYFLQQTKDLSRSIDYLQTRNDLNAGTIGYYGRSWGAAHTVRAVAVEERIKAAVLNNGGLQPWEWERPEHDPVHFLPRITIPVLMLNGKYDTIFPPRESQEPMFRLLGTDPARKNYRLFDGGHVAIPPAEQIQETVSWFDRYLGPVKRTGDPAVAPE